MTSKIAFLFASAVLASGAVVAIADRAQASTSACSGSAIVVSATETEGATGHGSLVLHFRNTSGRPCTLFGYPALNALDGRGRVVARAQRTASGFAGGSHNGTHAVVLRPGASASATVEWLNFNAATSGSCPFSQSIATAPPNVSHLVRLPRSVSTCELQVHPVVPGLSGNS
jgi:hypothetical protein